MQITISPELQELIDAEVRSGNFGTPDEFLRAAVRQFMIARDLDELYSAEEIDAKIRRGLDQSREATPSMATKLSPGFARRPPNCAGSRCEPVPSFLGSTGRSG